MFNEEVDLQKLMAVQDYLAQQLDGGHPSVTLPLSC